MKEKIIHSSAQQLNAHTPVMIRAFPESGFVIIPINGTVGTKAPEPFTVDIVNQMLPDESPTGHGML